MKPIKLKPHMQERIWGGTRLNQYGFECTNTKPIGEAWTVSAHPVGQSTVTEGDFAGLSVGDLWEKHPEVFGVDTSETFPLLIKWIDAADDLSVQVHPNDSEAQEREGVPFGKTECWYIVDCEERAEIIFGHTAKTKEELELLVNKGAWNDLLLKVPVKKGDFFFVPAGTVHALTKGVVVLEIQQSSDTTYRFYDYDRKDVSGNKRPLHIEDSLAVTKVPHVEIQDGKWEQVDAGAIRKTLTSNAYFGVEEVTLNGSWQYKTNQYAFISMVSGEVAINGVTTKMPETVLLAANHNYEIMGNGVFVLAVPPNNQKQRVQVGIDLGGTNIRVAAIKEDGKIARQWKMKTNVELGPDAILKEIIKLCQQAQSSFDVQSVGIAAPGPLDSTSGLILSPPNLPGWNQVPVVEILESALGLPVTLENDANAAAFGEAILGAGKEQESVFYMTVSTGIGGGFVYKNQLIRGAQDCAGEIGNMIIDSKGPSHTILNQGSLETLASGSALNSTIDLTKFEDLSELFRKSKSDQEAKNIIMKFIDHLSTGLANVIHMLNPDVIILGGGVMSSADFFLEDVIKKTNKKVYDQLKGKTSIKFAELHGDAGVLGAALLSNK
ncbi:type I phosphomannose isomerase catalytic subunit [Bacillus sp. JJ722]|uniref:type I phosphomannose isomerase catalytic subunit n=1 Tax=Bacillus sp. JJ722 TaxID=3122973 RepID=UPI003000C235